ncbi:mu2 [Drosophila busckii]|uniref:PAX-interacting protein 1 n=1 Tax=Drosophila busckii TaxID=30019 RepID=A0A0M4E8U8_DROBS|nr:mu2 [Drosophila busckii]
MVTLRFTASEKPMLFLEPDIIYRIGSRSGLELHSDDESMELAHATITLLSDDTVKLCAVGGRIYVNGSETEVRRITRTDANNGQVELRFGNAAAKLHFIDFEEALNSTGLAEDSVDITPDSFLIPETAPASANATSNMDSFNIPETQAVNFAMCDDFIIPETQDVRPALSNAPEPNVSEDDSSELGSQIRMCTQDFNEVNEDAFDDLDSSLLLKQASESKFNQTTDTSALNWSVTTPGRFEQDVTGKVPDADVPCTPDILELLEGNYSNEGQEAPATLETPEETPQDAIEDFDSSLLLKPARASKCNQVKDTTTLNWTGTNRNSTKHQHQSVRSEGHCITPELFQQDEAGKAEATDLPRTSDILELLEGNNSNEDQQASAALETPETTPTEQQERHEQDFIATQLFVRQDAIDDFDSSLLMEPPRRVSSTKIGNLVVPAISTNNSKRCSINHQDAQDLLPTQPFLKLKDLVDNQGNFQDFIATQAFISVAALEPSEDVPTEQQEQEHHDQDFMPTQPFVRFSSTKVDNVMESAISTNNSNNQYAQDFIPTQPFVKRKHQENLQDFIPTQAFTSPTVSPKATPPTQDMLATQLFVPQNEKTVAVVAENALDITNTLSMYDELDNELIGLVALADQSISPSDNQNLSESRLLELTGQLRIRQEPASAKVKKVRTVSTDSSVSGSESALSHRLLKSRNRKTKAVFKSTTSTPATKVHVAAKKEDLQSDSEDSNSIKQAASLNSQRLVRIRNCSLLAESFKYQAAEAILNKSQLNGEKTKAEQPTSSEASAQLHSLKDINSYLRSIKYSGHKIKISTSMCNLKQLEKLLSSLRNAIELSADPVRSDVLIMDRGERTYKFLVTVASGKPILCTKWLQSLKDTRSITVKPTHLFNDDKFETQYKFQPLATTKQAKLLRNIDFMLGTEIQPSAQELKAIIECAGGTVFTKPPRKNRFYMVASKDDMRSFQSLHSCDNVVYIKTEGVMQALVQNRVELLESYKLDIS